MKYVIYTYKFMIKKLLIGVTLFGLSTVTMAKTWTLNDCITYAIQNNITVQKNRVTEKTGIAELKYDQNLLWPSVSFSTEHGLTYRPLQDDMTVRSSEGGMTVSTKVTESSNYNVSMNWTVWNGGINRKNIEAQKITNEINALKTETSELTIQEQIVKLYVQIMYTREAVKVNESLAKTAEAQYKRGLEMQKHGQMAKADVVTLEAQLASTRYDVVNSQTQVADYKRQLKALLQLDLTDDFDVDGTIPEDIRALETVPEATDVYNYAVINRPEIKNAEKSIESADVQYNIAKRGYYPTISVKAGVADSHQHNSNSEAFPDQLKNNLNMSAGVTLSVPIWDQRKTKTNKEKAILQKTTAQLDLQDKKNTLSSTIEQYWLNACNGQQKFISAEASEKSQKTSFELVNEQFNNGLKNVVDVLQSRDKILSAEQTKLQSKYTTLLNVQLLKFYKGEALDL